MHVYLLLFFSKIGRIEPRGPRKPEKGTFQQKLKILLLFLSDKKIEGQPRSLPCPFSQSLTDKNSEIAILFNVVERYNNLSLQMAWPSRLNGGNENFPFLFTYAICFKEVFWHFQGGGGDFLRINFIRKEFPIMK